MISEVVVVRAVVELATRPIPAMLFAASTLVLLEVRFHGLGTNSSVAMLAPELDEVVDEIPRVRTLLGRPTEEEVVVMLATRTPTEPASLAIEATSEVEGPGLELATTVLATVEAEVESVVDKLTVVVATARFDAMAALALLLLLLLLLHVAELLDLSHAVQG